MHQGHLEVRVSNDSFDQRLETNRRLASIDQGIWELVSFLKGEAKEPAREEVSEEKPIEVSEDKPVEEID